METYELFSLRIKTPNFDRITKFEKRDGMVNGFILNQKWMEGN